MKPTDVSTFSQYLVGVCLVDRFSRTILSLPSAASINFRAACFEGEEEGEGGVTMKHVDIGYVCSVCLAVYSEHRKVCLQCGTQVYLKSS